MENIDNSYNFDYTIVTCFFDVRSKENNPHIDSQDRGYVLPDGYFDASKLLFEKEFPLIIYTEPKYADKIWNLRPMHLHHQTRVFVKDYEDLNMYCYFDLFERAHTTHKIHNLDPKKFTALYKFIVNQKTEFVKDAIMINPFKTNKFGWMDMRLHVVYNMNIKETNDIFNGLERSHVTIMQQYYPAKPHEITNRRDYYSVTRGKVCAGTFLGYKDYLLKFCHLCREEFLYAIRNNTAPTDEMVYSAVIAENHDLFEPKVGDYGQVLKNLLYTRENHNLAFVYMVHSSNNGKHYYKYKIAKSLCESYHNDATPFSNEQIVDIYVSIVSSGIVLQLLTESRNAIYELMGLCNHYNDLKTYIINENKHRFFIDSYIQSYAGINCSSINDCIQDESVETIRKFFGSQH